VQYRRLGASDLMVSEIALGTWAYSAGFDQPQVTACIRRALDLGINFFDTANVYGKGIAETMLGEALRGMPRRRYLLATKLYFPMSAADFGLSRAQVHKQLEASLRRLGTDYVDLYQCHRYDAATPLAETMAALSEVVRAGKARYIGFSEWPVAAIARALALPGVERFVASQPQYSLLWRQPEAKLFPFCAQHGIGQLAWSPLAQGVLSGKYRAGAAVPQGSRAAAAGPAAQVNRAFLGKAVLRAVARLAALARDRGLSPAQLALAWVLREPGVAAALTGAVGPTQIAENAAASGIALDAATLSAIERIMAPAWAAIAYRAPVFKLLAAARRRLPGYVLRPLGYSQVS
jgi:aryl-alcohol dehydrogenase-like predicted oxidoreductase